MSIALKVVAIVMAALLAIVVLGTAIGVGVNLVRYMANQNFDFGTAFAWSWGEFTNWMANLNPFGQATAEVTSFPFTNQNIIVVPCTNL